MQRKLGPDERGLHKRRQMLEGSFGSRLQRRRSPENPCSSPVVPDGCW
jgi:hypothetical protein